MGLKNRRGRLAKGLDHVLGVAPKLATEQGHDPEWLRGQLKAAIRVCRDVNRVLDLYEESFAEDIRRAVSDAMAMATKEEE